MMILSESSTRIFEIASRLCGFCSITIEPGADYCDKCKEAGASMDRAAKRWWGDFTAQLEPEL